MMEHPLTERGLARFAEEFDRVSSRSKDNE